MQAAGGVHTGGCVKMSRSVLLAGHYAGYGEHADGLGGRVAEFLRAYQGSHGIHLGGGLADLFQHAGGVPR